MLTTKQIVLWLVAQSAPVDDADNPYNDVTWTGGTQEPEIPGRIVMVNPATGPGLSTEWVTDVRGFDVTVIGEQEDYDSAEELALWVDRTILGAGGSRQMGDEWVVDVNRFGSAPYNTEVDDADRYHFVCSYLFEVQSGLVLN